MYFASLALLLVSLLPVKGLLPVLDDLGVWDGIEADDYLMKDGVGAFLATTPQPTTTILPTQTTTTAILTSTTDLPFITFSTTVTDPDMTLPLTVVISDTAGNEIVIGYDTETSTTRFTSNGIVVAQEIILRVPRTTITHMSGESPTTTFSSQPTGTTT
jgi:hypothetical protein